MDSALPRREHLGLVGLLGLGLLLDLDLEGAELVVPSKDAVVLRKRREGVWLVMLEHIFLALGGYWAAGGSSSKTQRGLVRLRLGFRPERGTQRGIWLWGLWLGQVPTGVSARKGCGR